MAKSKSPAQSITEPEPVIPHPSSLTPHSSSLLCTLSVPLAADVQGYLPRNIELKVNAEESATLARLRQHLDETGATLTAGQPVKSTPQALRWLLQQLTQAAQQDSHHGQA